MTIRIERQATGEWMPLVYCSFCYKVVSVVRGIYAYDANSEVGQHTLVYALHADEAGRHCRLQ